MATTNPFTKRDFDKLQAAKRAIHDLLPKLDSAQRCGIECEEFRELAEHFRSRLDKLQTEFMTPPPTR